jgi:chemotaxis protein MotB
MERELAQLAVLLAGRRNAVEIRGHAAPKHLPLGSPWRDLDELSFDRARRVRDVLAAHGVDERRMRIVVIGDREPVHPRSLDPLDAAENRRVEIILTEVLVDEMGIDPLFAGADGARR